MKNSIAGSSHDASSRLPALISATPGASAEVLKTGAPHAEQKLRSVAPSWSSPIVVNERNVSPSTVNASLGTPTNTVNGLPVWRWQSVQ